MKPAVIRKKNANAREQIVCKYRECEGITCCKAASNNNFDIILGLILVEY